MKQVILHHHLGLGDHFICNGLVHALKRQLGLDRLVMPVKEHNIPTVRCLYQVREDIELLPIPKQHYQNDDAYFIQRSSYYEVPSLKISYGGGGSTVFLTKAFTGRLQSTLRAAGQIS